jgi:hypothetical protein
MTKNLQSDATFENMPHAVWGARNIGVELGLSASQVLYLLRKTSVLDRAVQKVAHRTIVGSRKKLRDVAVPTL